MKSYKAVSVIISEMFADINLSGLELIGITVLRSGSLKHLQQMREEYIF